MLNCRLPENGLGLLLPSSSSLKRTKSSAIKQAPRKPKMEYHDDKMHKKPRRDTTTKTTTTTTTTTKRSSGDGGHKEKYSNALRLRSKGAKSSTKTTKESTRETLHERTRSIQHISPRSKIRNKSGTRNTTITTAKQTMSKEPKNKYFNKVNYPLRFIPNGSDNKDSRKDTTSEAKTRALEMPSSSVDEIIINQCQIKSMWNAVKQFETIEDKQLVEPSKLLPKSRLYTSTPDYIEYEAPMKEYQITGLNWMISLYEQGRNGILADDMGLGKSVQVIAFIGYMKNVIQIDGHHIVIAPLSILQHWVNEFKKWCPTIRVICLIGDQQRRRKLLCDALADDTMWDVCVTSYEICLREEFILRSYKWHYMFIDEGHRLKNEEIALSVALSSFHANNRILMTGTPYQNNIHELWALLNFIDPQQFPNSEEFDEHFRPKACAHDADLVQKLQKILKPLMLRRMKSVVAKELAPKEQFVLREQLSPFQKERYAKILSKNLHIINAKGNTVKRDINNLMVELRKCCNHPKLMDDRIVITDHKADLVLSCGKMVMLDKLLGQLQMEGSRVLIFSQMRRMLDILEKYCIWRQFKYCRLDGQTKQGDRQNAINDYNAHNSDKFIFLMTTRAGGIGLNLCSANVVIIYDLDWNPQVDLQAVDRAHRIGQKKQVRVYRLITVNTIEEKVLQCNKAKLRLDDLIIQKGAYAHSNMPNAKELIANMRSSAKELLGKSEIGC